MLRQSEQRASRHGFRPLAEVAVSAYSDGVIRSRFGPSDTPTVEDRADFDVTGDQIELEAAYATHRDELLGFARRSLGDAELAEDAVQETFVRAWRSRQRFNPGLGAMRTWLFAIERHIVVDLARLRRARPTDELDSDLASPHDHIGAALRSAQVEEVLRALAPLHRQVIVEIYFHGRSGRELARELGLPEGTVRSRLFYALRALRVGLAAQGWEP